MTGLTAAVAARALSFRNAWRVPHQARSVNQRILVSGTLSSLQFGVEGITRLISTVVMTRLLAPEDFGAYAVVLFVLYLMVMVTDLGIRSIILTREGGADATFLRCCWTIQLIRGAAIGAGVVAIGLTLAGLQAAGAVAGTSAYANPDLPWVICAASVVLLVQSAESPNPFVYERDMRFTRVALVRTSTGVTGSVLTIVSVWATESIWGLLLGQIAGTALRVAASFLMFHGPAMVWRLERSRTQVILERGKWIMSHSGLRAATELADRVLFSVFFSATDFGFYYLARQIVLLFTSLAERIVSSFSLQHFTHLLATHDRRGVSREYYRLRTWLDAYAAIVGGGLFIAAPALIDMLYDDRYATVGRFLQLLALGLPLVGIGVIRGAFSAQRRFRAMTLMSVLQTASIWIFAGAALVIFHSPTAAVLAVALHRLPELAVLMWKARHEGWIQLRREIRIIPLFAIGAGLGWVFALGWAAVSG